MGATISQDRFVNVVARVDTASGDGKLLYVNPSRNAVMSDGEHPMGFEFVVENAAGEELARVPAQVRVSSCKGEGDPGGLIQQDLPFIEGARRIRLLYNRAERDRYEAAAPRPPGAMGLGFAAGAQPHKKIGEIFGEIASEPGATYTVEARPVGATAWQAIVVGRPTPQFDLDRNQFPGAANIDVRVLRSTGFEAQVIAEERFQAED